MSTATLTLTDFLLARIAEDEAVVAEIRLGDFGYDALSNRRFAAYSDFVEVGPARVLAECAAKRAIVAIHEADDTDPRDCGICGGSQPAAHPCPTLRALASVYADHADYQAEWR